jgi:tRNA(fMet)-specific endonuclease VapC
LILDQIKAHSASIFIPSIVIGELFYGVEQSSKRNENRARIDLLVKIFDVLECDTDTARLYGKIKSELKGNGTPIPENDIWIAAQARQHDLVLVTRDKHFDGITGLTLERWTSQVL